MGDYLLGVLTFLFLFTCAYILPFFVKQDLNHDVNLFWKIAGRASLCLLYLVWWGFIFGILWALCGFVRLWPILALCGVVSCGIALFVTKSFYWPGAEERAGAEKK